MCRYFGLPNELCPLGLQVIQCRLAFQEVNNIDAAANARRVWPEIRQQLAGPPSDWKRPHPDSHDQPSYILGSFKLYRKPESSQVMVCAGQVPQDACPLSFSQIEPRFIWALRRHAAVEFLQVSFTDSQRMPHCVIAEVTVAMPQQKQGSCEIQ